MKGVEFIRVFSSFLIVSALIFGCQYIDSPEQLSNEVDAQNPTLSEKLGFGSIIEGETSQDADLVIDLVSKKSIYYYINEMSTQEHLDVINSSDNERSESIYVDVTARHAEGNEYWEDVTLSFNDLEINRRTDQDDFRFYLRNALDAGDFSPSNDVTISVSKPGLDWSSMVPSTSIGGGNVSANPVAHFRVDDMNHNAYFRKDKSLCVNWIDVFPDYSDDTYFIMCTHDKPCYSQVIRNGVEQTIIPSSEFSFLDVGDEVTFYLVRMNEDCYRTENDKSICIRQAMLTRAFNLEVIDGPI